MRDIPRIAEIARKNIRQRSLRTSDIVAVWIVVDSMWKNLALEIMPQCAAQWEREIAAGIEPVARGLVLPEVCAKVARRTPELTAQIMETPEPGRVKLLALDEVGSIVYQFDPFLAPGA